MSHIFETTEQILATLAPLFEEARAKGLWFQCQYDGQWYTPDELAHRQASGRLIWGKRNWRIADPQEGVDNLNAQVENAVRERDAFAAKVQAWKESTK